MTSAPAVSPPESSYQPPSRRPTWPRWRPAMRLAVRDSRTHWRRSALIVSLVALPVGLVLGSVMWSASRQAADLALGGPDLGDPGPIPDGATLGIAVGFVQIVLLAGAAFVVTARRRRRELALLAAAGAEPGDLTRAVLAQAALLGGVGALLGSLVPYLALSLGAPIIEATTGWQLALVPPISRALLLVPILGVLAGVVASLPAARQVAAIPLAEALRSRDGAGLPSTGSGRRARVWLFALAGVVLIGLGVQWIAGYVRSSDGLWEGGLRGGGALALGVGVVAAQLGVVMLSPALLWVVTWPRHLPVPARLAARDAARNGLRSAFAVAAVAAATGLAGAALVWTGSVAAAARESYVPALPTGALVVQPGLPDGAQGHEAEEAARAAATLDEDDRAAIAAGFPGARVALIGLASVFEAGLADGLALQPQCDPVRELGASVEQLHADPTRLSTIAANLPDDSPCLAPTPAGSPLRTMATVAVPGYPDPGVIVLSAEDVELVLGRDDSRVRAALEGGSAVALSPRAAVEGTVRLAQTAQWLPEPTQLPVADLPVSVVADVAVWPGALLVTPEILANAGLRAGLDAAVVVGAAGGEAPEGYVVAYREQGSPGLREVSWAGPFFALDLPRNPRDLVGLWGALVFALIATVLVTGLAVSEARGEFAVMAAVGAAPRIRRSFAASSAGIVGVVGGLLGALAGILLGWAGLSALGWLTDPARCLWLPEESWPGGWVDCRLPVQVPLSIPWVWLLGLALLVPAVAALVQYVVTSSRSQVPRR